jgi:Flp pilus assembly protein TadB
MMNRPRYYGGKEVMIMRLFKYYLPGIVFIAAAVLIMAVPEILVAMVSALIMVMGFIALAVGHGIRKSEIKLKSALQQAAVPPWRDSR